MKVTVIGQIKNKKTGLGKAINDVIKYIIEKNSKITEIDITNNKLFFNVIKKIITSDTDVFYFTSSGSVGGNIRDSIYLFFMITKRKKIVTHFHNSAFGKVINSNVFTKIVNKYLYSKVDKIIVLGEKSKAMFTSLNIPENRFVVIRNGIDDYLFIEKDRLKEKFLDSDINIIFFSNMLEEKGYKIVLDVAEKMKLDDKYKFYFSGKFFDISLEDEFKQKIKQLHNVTYIDGVYCDEKKALLEKMHYFILPSSYKDETLPISMLEAMANGVYIIVSDVGVISEVINENTTKLLLKINNNTAMLIRNVILDTSNKLGELEFKIEELKRKYSNEKIQAEIFEVIKKLI